MSIRVVGLHSFDGGGEGSGARNQNVAYKSFAFLPPNEIGPDLVNSAVIGVAGIDIGTPQNNDLTSICRSIKSRCVGRIDTVPPKWEWLTTFEFSSKGTDTKDTAGNTVEPTNEKDPAMQPPHVTVHSERYQTAATKDKYNYPIRNSAGDPIIRMKDRSRIVIRYSRVMKFWDYRNCYEAVSEAPGIGLDGNFPLDIVNHVGFMFTRNYHPWAPGGPLQDMLGNISVPRGQARIEDVRVEPAFDCGRRVRVYIEVHLDPLGFEDRFIDQGFFHLVTANPYTAHPLPFLVDNANPYMQNITPSVPSVAPSSPTSVPPSLGRQRFYDRHGQSTAPQLLDGFGNPHPGGNVEPAIARCQHYFFRDFGKNPLVDFFR